MKDINVVCGGLDVPDDLPKGTLVQLDVQGENKNVELKIEALSKAVMRNIPDALLDLLEIGAYVYCADQQVRRGSNKLTNYGSDWRRWMNFIIPVRDPDLWNGTDLKQNLERTLGFLSGETYQFTFVQAENPVTQITQYIEFADNPMTPDEVVLFSGGVDSFAGAVESIIGQNKKVALVGHHSANKVKSVQKTLIDGLETKGHAKKLQYISIEVRNSSGNTALEYTQRTRSFLFACLAMGIAHMYGKDRFTFYENGVVSLNLPLTKDVLESRATRTTHPRVINGMKEIFSLVFDKQITVDHPYQWLTKAEVTKKIEEYECQDLLGTTNSCTRPRSWSATKTHCGVCSQCIDRRFGVLAAGLEEFDPQSQYKVDLLTGARSDNDEIVMAASYVKFAQQFQGISLGQFVTEHPQISSAFDEFPKLTTQEAEEKIFDLYRRYTQDVIKVIDDGYLQNKKRFSNGEMPLTSILSIFFNRNKIEVVPASDYGEQLKQTLDKLGKQRCQFFLDESNSRIVFKGGYEINGTHFNLINALIGNFRHGKSNDSEPDYIPAGTLATTLNIEEPTLRKQILRLRNEVSKNLGVDQGIVFDTDGFIENSQTKGYRLNTQLREVMSLSDLED